MSLRIGKRWRAAALATAAVVAPLMGMSMTTADAAVGSVFVSEVAPWSSGNSTFGADWFEVTNTASSAVSMSGWTVDDNSNLFSSSLPLIGVTSLAAGQSAIFIETSTPAATIDAFKTSWFGSVAAAPSGLAIGTYSGSGIGLSTGGDAVNIYSSSGTLITNVTFGAATTASPFRTFDNAASVVGPISQLSIVGVNGAFNAVLPGANMPQTGSPGTIVTAGGGTTTTTAAPTPTTTTTTIPGPAYQAWPGSPNVQTVDLAATFTSNLSGLDYEGTGSAVPGVIWGALNGPGSLFRLVFNGTDWVPDTANNWGAGKGLRYPGGGGEADAEGVTFVGDSSSVDGIYISAERDNLNNTVSRNSVIRYDPTAGGATLTATNEWNLTGDIPANAANAGFEGITWIQDSFLVAHAFFDETKNHSYNPTEYANHGAGLFFVGVEATGNVYVYALSPDNTFARVASFSSGFTQVMDLQFDRDLNDLWAVCDNGCNGRMNVLRINPSTGRFEVALRFERPTGMPNTNNEGFAIAPATYCADGVKPVYWSDDNDINQFSLRTGTLPCAGLVVAPPQEVPEFPAAALPIGAAGGLMFGAWLLVRRRSLRTL